jgi:hypothetical protein
MGTNCWSVGLFVAKKVYVSEPKANPSGKKVRFPPNLSSYYISHLGPYAKFQNRS